MPGAGPLDLFSPDNDPAVIEARKSVHAARRAVRRAPYGQKRKKEKELRAAVIHALRAELAAEKKLKEARYVPPKDAETKTEAPQEVRQIITRESGDDTNYRPGARKA